MIAAAEVPDVRNINSTASHAMRITCCSTMTKRRSISSSSGAPGFDVLTGEIHIVRREFQQGGLGGIDESLRFAEMLLKLDFLRAR